MSPSPQAVIRLQGVSKVFPDVPPGTPPALSSLTADVPSGLVVGLVGPDAAGKTTLMRLLAGLLLPTSGSVEVLGRVPGSEASDEAVHDVGYMPQRFGLYEDLSVIDNLNLHAELRGLEGPARQAMFEKLLTFTALKPFTDRLAGKLSGGMKRKLMVCRALLTDPEILLLDEPTAGMDALSRRQMWNLLRKLNGKNLTILLTTHYMEEAQNLCSRVALMDHGKLEEVNTPAGLIDSLGNYTVDEFAGDETHSHYFHSREEAIAYLSGLSGQASLRETTLEDVLVERAGRHLMPS